MNSAPHYVLITPAKNEARFIGYTIESVVNQTIRPSEWVIVSDGSTDRTDELVSEAAVDHPWMRLLRLQSGTCRNFGSVVQAIEMGLQHLNTQDHSYIGLLDADVCFRPDYFQCVIQQFEASPRLGLAGGWVVDHGERKDRFPRNRADIPGAAQFYRRGCFEAMNGLLAIPEGGWDALTCARVRMLGYETRLLTHLIVDHLKPRNIAEGGSLRRRFQMGARDYALGYHPFFEFFKCLSRFLEKPCLVGAFVWWWGYCSSAIRGRERLIPDDLLEFMRGEQKRRLLQLFSPLLPDR